MQALLLFLVEESFVVSLHIIISALGIQAFWQQGRMEEKISEDWEY